MRLYNHVLYRIIPDPGSQNRMTLSLESISTIPFQARPSDVKCPERRQHCFNRGMPCLVIIFHTLQWTGDQPNTNPGPLLRCMAVIFSHIIARKIKWPGMLVVQNIGHLDLIGCTNDWHNWSSIRKLILHIPQPIACLRLAVY
jgi:hypothetical protein